MAETINLGIVGIKNMGEYDSQTEYEKLNVVTYQGSSYCALRDTVGNLPTNTDYWQLYAQKGDIGATGATGATGPRGPQGIPGEPSGTPLVAESISDMIDTTKVYVNTTDGHWYWYDGDSWEDGGIYQATGISLNDDVIQMLLGRSRNLINIQDDITINKTNRTYDVDVSDYGIEENKEYNLSFLLTNVVESTSSNNNLVVRAIYSNTSGDYTQLETDTIVAGRHNVAFTPTKDVQKISFIISSSVSDGTTLDVEELQIKLGSEFTGFVPYYTAGDKEARLDIEDIMKYIGSSYKINKVSTFNDLKKAIETGGIISIIDDITVTEDIHSNLKDCYIIGNGHTLTGSGLSTYLLNITNKKMYIYNLNFIGDDDANYCVVANTGAFLYAENCNIHYAKDSVVRCINTSKVKLVNCDVGFSKRNDGIAPAGTADVRLYNTNSHDNYDEGISSHNSSYCEVHGGEFYNNGYERGTKNKGAQSSFGGVHLGGGKMGIVEGVYSHDNCTYGIALINFQDVSQTDKERCFNNLIENNGNAGIFVTGARDFIINNNTILYNAESIHFGLDHTYTPTVDLVASHGIVIGNDIYGNMNDNIIIDTGADDGITIVS